MSLNQLLFNNSKNSFSGVFGEGIINGAQWKIEAILSNRTTFMPAWYVNVTDVNDYFRARGWKNTTVGKVLPDALRIFADVYLNYSANDIEQSAKQTLEAIQPYPIVTIKATKTGQPAYITNTQPAITPQTPTTPSALQTAYTFYKDGILYSYDATTNTVKQVATSTSNAVKQTVTTIEPYVYDFGNNVSDAAKDAADKIAGFEVPDFIKNFADSLKITIPLALMILVLFGVIILKKR